jgi:GPH family glycoside/pentoside/hexuronide:cation symporter
MTENPAHTPYSASNKAINFWAVGAIADYMMYAMFALIPPFFTTSFGMDPIWVSWALFLPRIFDGVADPIIGHWSDNTHTRWGRRRPFILVSAVFGACLIVGVWWMSPDWPSWMQFTFLLVMSLLLFLCWGTYTMNHLALGYELSDDYHIRTKVIAVRGFYFSCAAMTGSYYYWIAGLKYFKNDVQGMRIESVVIAVAAFCAALFAVSFSRERFQKANRKHVNIIAAIKAALSVKPFVILLGLRMIASLGAGLSGAVIFYIGVYSVCQGDKHLYLSLPIWNGWIGLAMAGALVFVAARMSRLLGKRRGLILSYGVAFLAACMLPIFAQPGWPYLLLAHMIIFGPIFATMLGVFQIAVMPDICDIDELKSGERREGLFSAVNSFVSKMENSLLALVGGYIVSFSGFNAKHAAAIPPIPQTPEVLEHLRWMGFTPAIIFSGIVFLLSWFYPVTEQMMADVREQLDARRRAGRAQEGLAEPVQ